MHGFRDFIFRGNVIDLAVAFVIGAAFTTVVTSFVADILTPLMGLLGMPDLAAMSLSLGQAELRYGMFLTALISFVVIAAAIYFFVVVPVQRTRQPEAAATKTCPFCASEIPLAARRCPMCTSELG